MRVDDNRFLVQPCGRASRTCCGDGGFSVGVGWVLGRAWPWVLGWPERVARTVGARRAWEQRDLGVGDGVAGAVATRDGRVVG